MVRAKFHVNFIQETISNFNTDTGKYDPEIKDRVQTVHMHPVYFGSPENKEFFFSTPAGQISMVCRTPDLFEEGEDYYVDFTKAE
jgi:hypothetical protein